MSDENFKVVPIESLKIEDGADELMSTPEMQPYLRYIEAAMLKRVGNRCSPVPRFQAASGR